MARMLESWLSRVVGCIIAVRTLFLRRKGTTFPTQFIIKFISIQAVFDTVRNIFKNTTLSKQETDKTRLKEFFEQSLQASL